MQLVVCCPALQFHFTHSKQQFSALVRIISFLILQQREFAQVCYKYANVYLFMVADTEKMQLFALGADAHE